MQLIVGFWNAFDFGTIETIQEQSPINFWFFLEGVMTKIFISYFSHLEYITRLVKGMVLHLE